MRFVVAKPRSDFGGGLRGGGGRCWCGRGDADGEGAEGGARGEVSGGVADLGLADADGVDAVVGGVPRAAGGGEAVGDGAGRAVAGDVDAEEGGDLREAIGTGDEDVAAVEGGGVEGDVVGVAELEL